MNSNLKHYTRYSSQSSCTDYSTSLLAPVSKWNSDTWQIGDVQKIQKELFQYDDLDDNTLATAAAEAKYTLLSEK